ncbi:MAG: hypothetical protein NTY19_25495 [Planctomycetota bacterium]|nr:hypothetical protein [Planctomycetota bacterium]
MPSQRITTAALLACTMAVCNCATAAKPPDTDYCQRLQQEVQGKKHGFLAGNVAYYIGGFHACWNLKEHETLGLTHPFYHDLRSRGVGVVESAGAGPDNTGLGNDLSGWEFYKDTRVLYGSVLLDGQTHRHPIPSKMFWRPDRMICEYEVGGVTLHEEKFIADNDAACSIITSSKPVTVSFGGQSFFGRDSLSSSATIEYDRQHNAIHVLEGGTTTCLPETDRTPRTGPIMYQGMSTVLAASRDFSATYTFAKGEHGQVEYTFEVPCDSHGVTVVWAMHDDYRQALQDAVALAQHAGEMLTAKTVEMNRQLNEEIPWFRCSDKKLEDIYYYLWSLYLMYYIDVQKGWEMEHHTQTAVNNFLGMHRYDATFQIKVGAWTADKPRYAYGNVLTWKHLFRHGRYKRFPDGAIALADNKGTTWHSGVYGLELSEHVLGDWQISQHTGDQTFVRDCYDGYFHDVFWERIPSFFLNEFEVAEALIEMAKITGRPEDVDHWRQLVPLDPKKVRAVYDQRWEANGHRDFFGGPKDGMLMTTGFWPMRTKYFPHEYAIRMVEAWALDRERGFFGEFFPLAMSKQAMQTFHTSVDQSFGYTSDTAYFTLIGMFRQYLGDPAWRLTLNHLKNYNYCEPWGLPVAPEAYDRFGHPFGDQYSNFNAGKILLYLEGLAGIEYSVPDDAFRVCDTMPTDWDWMELSVPIRKSASAQTVWTGVRLDRKTIGGQVIKSIRVSDSPLRVTIEPWLEKRTLAGPEILRGGEAVVQPSPPPGHAGYTFAKGTPNTVSVEVTLGN